MAKAGKRKRGRRGARRKTLGAPNPVSFRKSSNGKSNEAKPEKLTVTGGQTVVFNNFLNFNVVILMYGPPFVLTDPSDPTMPAGVELSDSVRGIFVPANTPSDSFGTTNNVGDRTRYRVIVDPSDPNGNIGGSGFNRSGQDPEIIIGG